MKTIICTLCNKEGHDWMVDAELVTPDKAICGKCKIEIGTKAFGTEMKRKIADENAEGK